MGTVAEWPVSVSILTQYGDSDCCVSGFMRHTPYRATKVAGKDPSAFSASHRSRTRCGELVEARRAQLATNQP